MRLLAAALAFLAMFATARAEPGVEALGKRLYEGALAQGEAAEGMLRFVAAIEHLAQAMHRHGLETRSGGPMMNLPILRIPVPPNPNPEKLDYAKFRAMLQRLVEDLDAVETALAPVGDKDVKLPVELLKVRLDLNGDGTIADYESLGGLMSNLAPGMVPPRAPVNFDTADVYWLRGYSRFISAFAQFLLAHDFHDTFDKTFHIYFPNAGLPLADRLRRSDARDAWGDPSIGDAIAFLHLINWPVSERDRLGDVRLRLKTMAEMSRLSWRAARRETDDDAEWLPNAKQKGAFGQGMINDQVIDGWIAVMSEFEAILDGKKLLPHWRFNQGLNVKRMFEESKNFDFVLLIAGADAVPWLEDGPVSSSADWNSLMNVFQGNFLGYAMWFN